MPAATSCRCRDRMGIMRFSSISTGRWSTSSNSPMRSCVDPALAGDADAAERTARRCARDHQRSPGRHFSTVASCRKVRHGRPAWRWSTAIGGRLSHVRAGGSSRPAARWSAAAGERRAATRVSSSRTRAARLRSTGGWRPHEREFATRDRAGRRRGASGRRLPSPTRQGGGGDPAVGGRARAR